MQGTRKIVGKQRQDFSNPFAKEVRKELIIKNSHTTNMKWRLYG
jgi:hypothetical protein